MVNVSQLNLNPCKVVRDLLIQLANDKKAAVVIISEQYQNHGKCKLIRDASGKAVSWVGEDLDINKKMVIPAPGFTWVEIVGIRIYSCHLLPSNSINEFLSSVDAMVASAKSYQVPLVIRVDCNTWAEKWSSTKINQRGKALLVALAILELKIANSETKPTFAKGGKTFIV